MKAAPAAASCALADGVVALAPGVAWLPASRAIVAADAHLAYEDVIGAALPLWSTAEIVATLSAVARSAGAREIIFLGDIVHGPRMSEGAMRAVRAALDRLREEAAVEFAERDGRLLVHGDGPAELGRPTIIGHLHPSLRLGGAATAPAFVGCQALVVLPALNPYSPGLDVASDTFAAAIGLWNVRREDVQVVACAGELLYPFGSLSRLREGMREPTIRRADRA